MPLSPKNLDDVTFQQIAEEAKKAIPVLAPAWTNHNVPDPGITFSELFAWLVEMQIYSLNQVSPANQRKFLKLAGTPGLAPPVPARAKVTFTTLSDPDIKVPAGTLLTAEKPGTGREITFYTLTPATFQAQRTCEVDAIQYKPHKDTCFDSTGLPGFYLQLESQVLAEGLNVNVKEGSGEHGEWRLWQRVEDFTASTPGDRHYTLDYATGRLSFGNGINGKIPLPGNQRIKITYHSCSGIGGNVAARTIIKVPDQWEHQVSVTNTSAASGGTNAQTLEQALNQARKDLGKKHRAVTSNDYENLALETPGCEVARASAHPGLYSDWKSQFPGIVTVIVVPIHKTDHNPAFLKKVYRWLDHHRLLTTELFVIFPGYTTVSVETTIVIKKEFDKEKIKKQVKEKLNRFLDPVKGGSSGSGWPFGRPVYRSEISALIQQVQGVDYIKKLQLNHQSKKDIIIPQYHLVEPGTHTIEIFQEK